MYVYMYKSNALHTCVVIVISKLLKRYSKAKRTRAPAYSRALQRIKGGFPKGVKRSSGPISRVPGGDFVKDFNKVFCVHLCIIHRDLACERVSHVDYI